MLQAATGPTYPSVQTGFAARRFHPGDVAVCRAFQAFLIGGLESMPVLEDDTWNAGDMGCGELVLELRMRLQAMPGRVLKLIATDAGAPEDIPAYCRMTRHELVHVSAPEYWIRARTLTP